MKTLLLKAAAFGAGFAVLSSAIITGGYYWASRPKQERSWNASALTATFSDVDAWQQMKPDGTPDDRGSLEFRYVIENRLANDYSTDGTGVVAMLRRPDGLAASEGDIQVTYPIFIPSGQRVAVKIAIPYGSVLDATIDDKDIRRQIREKLPELAGFVLFDRANRYQIDLPKGW